MIDNIPHRQMQKQEEHWRGENSVEQMRPGTGAPKPNNHVTIIAVSILLGAALITLAFGWLRQQGWPTLEWVGQPLVRITGGAGGSVLYSQSGSNWSQVMVQRPSDASWQLVSLGDMTATAAALSEDGASVAYRSASSDQAIKFVDLVGNRRTAVADNEISAAGQKANIPGLVHCNWTSVDWSPDGQQAAFLSCTTQPLERSYVTVVEVTYPIQSLSIITNSVVESTRERNIQWLGNKAVITTNPPVGSQPASQAVYPVP